MGQGGGKNLELLDHRPLCYDEKNEKGEGIYNE